MITAEILDVAQDPKNKSIIVRTQYKIDGVEVVSPYPQLNGKYYFQTRYNINQFAGMTDLQVKQRILLDLRSHGENLIRKTYFKQVNFQFAQDKANKLIGTTGTIQTAEILVDTNGDNIKDTKWIVYTDGHRDEEPYTP